jgi:hypothetical protein
MVISFDLPSVYFEKKDSGTYWIYNWMVSERSWFSVQERNIFMIWGFYIVIGEGYGLPGYDVVLTGKQLRTLGRACCFSG